MSTPLRIFVAMPGTTMGPNAFKDYDNPQAVKDNLLEPVSKKLEQELGRHVELVIEKDKLAAGAIHKSMFDEAYRADVYIADLTGANPNVYLELGVRWALKDKVTVLISQSIEDIKFNPAAARAMIYTPATIVRAQEHLTTTIVNGLNSSESDSLVRDRANLLTVSREEIEALRGQIAELTRARGGDLLNAARATEDSSEKLRTLEQAMRVNPSSTEVLLEAARTHHSLADYPKAIELLKKATKLAPEQALLQRELGVIYAKAKQVVPAIEALKEAVRLDPRDAEAWSNLGGAYRRAGTDRESLSQSRAAYERAHEIKKHDLYAALNISRIDLLLSRWEPERRERATDGFAKQVHLCRFEVEDEPKNYWRRFDLADALLFSGKRDQAFEAFDEAIALVPVEERADKIGSVLGPFETYIEAGVLEGDLREDVDRVVEKLKSAVSSAR